MKRLIVLLVVLVFILTACQPSAQQGTTPPNVTDGPTNPNPTDPNPTPRTAEFYKVRPCARMVLVAGRLLDEFIAEHPIERETP